jgi:hypothetical protein
MLQIHIILVVYTTVSDLQWKFFKTSLSVLNLLSPVLDYDIYFIVVFLIMISTLVMCGLIKCNIRKRTREANQQNSNNVYRAQ